MRMTKNSLNDWTAPGSLAERVEGETVRCLACAHGCVLRPGQRGLCRVRLNEAGVLRVPWGYVAGAQLDPIEKKPFAHVLPGRMALTFGMLGCNFHCDFCQNWTTTQVLRDAAVELSPYAVQPVSSEALVRAGQEAGAAVMVSSYNEPLITSEWAIEIFERAHANGLLCAMVSNGYASAAARQALRPHLDALKVDLKTMQEEQYRQMGGRLGPVLDTIRWAFESGLWVEVVTLVIPGLNDSPDELWQAARFLASVSPDIPWHVTPFTLIIVACRRARQRQRGCFRQQRSVRRLGCISSMPATCRGGSAAWKIRIVRPVRRWWCGGAATRSYRMSSHRRAVARLVARCCRGAGKVEHPHSRHILKSRVQ